MYPVAVERGFYAAKLILAVLVGFRLGGHGLPFLAYSLVGFMIPDGLLYLAAKKRKEKILCTLPEMLDFLRLEYVHRHDKSVINQREIGRDVLSFPDGLRAALREDPDVILIGEMRDLETVEIALQAAKTGHLVLSTLHTGSAAEKIERVISMFPGERQAVARLDLADALQGVISQQLVRRRDGGRVPAMEILVVTPAVRNLIREGKSHHISTAIQTGGSEGMVIMEKSLSDLIRAGLVDEEIAREKVLNQKLLAEYPG